jgi:alkanesulfonate monooxygenase SsuD/methylene tetrahydromethanopterin reductase-like flavin-dependent oxidoreductase (luciferase family)
MMWTEDEVNFDGRYYNVKGARCYPRSTTPPTIMIGGGGEKKTLKVVAGYADWWNIPAIPIKTLQHKIEVLKGHCSSIGRDFKEIRKTLEGFVAIAETKEEADKIASRGRQAHFSGTPEMVVEQLNKYIDLGFEYYLVRFLDQTCTSGAKLFAKRVVPFLNCRTR